MNLELAISALALTCAVGALIVALRLKRGPQGADGLAGLPGPSGVTGRAGRDFYSTKETT